MEEQPQPEFAGRILHRVMHENATSLNISRIPRDVKIKFIALSNNEFVGDYGLALKALLEFADRAEAQQELLTGVYEELSEIKGMIAQLSHKKEASDVEEIKALDGSVIGKRRKRT